jgi:hypothetical protein
LFSKRKIDDHVREGMRPEHMLLATFGACSAHELFIFGSSDAVGPLENWIIYIRVLVGRWNGLLIKAEQDPLLVTVSSSSAPTKSSSTFLFL